MSLFITNEAGQYAALRCQGVCSVAALTAVRDMAAKRSFVIAPAALAAVDLILGALGRLSLSSSEVRLLLSKEQAKKRKMDVCDSHPYEFARGLCWHSVSEWRNSPQRYDEKLVSKLGWDEIAILHKNRAVLSRMLEQAGFLINNEAFLGISRSNKSNTLSFSATMDINDPTRQKGFVVFLSIPTAGPTDDITGYLTQQNGVGSLVEARVFPSMKAIEIAAKKNGWLKRAVNGKSAGVVEISVAVERLVSEAVPPGFAPIQSCIDQRLLQGAGDASGEDLQRLVRALANAHPELVAQAGREQGIDTTAFLKASAVASARSRRI